MKTSRSRQLAWSCTSRQSLANRVSRDGDSGTPRWEQISSASAGWAEPLKTVISRTGALDVKDLRRLIPVFARQRNPAQRRQGASTVWTGTAVGEAILLLRYPRFRRCLRAV